MRSVCVYCGSSTGRQPVYRDAARDFGRRLAQRELRLVYGGASIGLMGAVADAVLAHGGQAIGVIPESLMADEVAHRGLTELHITQSMHERKTLMAELADAFVALPGGLGTFEELFEILTWAQLGFHHKPCGLLDVAGYYAHLQGLLQNARDEAFVRPEHGDLLLIETDPGALLDGLTTAASSATRA